jgi:argininosuccinate lyase
MLSTSKFNKERMRDSALKGFTNATDVADYLVKNGMPFRDAHRVSGEIVLKCLSENKAIEDLKLDELKEFSELFKEDIYEAISLETCVNKRVTIGGPGKEAMSQVIKLEKQYLSEDWLDKLEEV